jgi:hypothetical protein
MNAPESVTGKYLSGEAKIEIPKRRPIEGAPGAKPPAKTKKVADAAKPSVKVKSSPKKSPRKASKK